MDMSIDDFGPIKKAFITLRPLTILIGPNDAGKSYAAMLAHSAMSAARGLGPHSHPPARTTYGRKRLSALDELEKMLAGLRPSVEVKCPPDLAYHLTRSCASEYGASLKGEIVRNFGSSLADLARSGADHFSLSLRDKSGRTMALKKDSLVLSPLPKFDMRFKLLAGAGGLRVACSERGSDTLNCYVTSGMAGKHATRSHATRLYFELKQALLRHVLADIPDHSDYFPASRSGILQAHRLLASNVVRNAAYSGIEAALVPRLPGVASDLVSAIIDAHPAQGVHHDVGNRIENDILAGHVNLKHRNAGGIPEIVYERSRVAVPIHRTSSTISGLAPLTLYLKHAAACGVIIIEEPEAHLHPLNQATLAGHLVRLVRDGAGIIITTHSAPLFEAISQYLQAGSLRPKDRQNALGHKDLYLGEHEVAPHLFRQSRGGSVVEPVDMSSKEGIDQEEFIKGDRLLNENNMRIEECIQ